MKSLRDFKTVQERREALEKEAGISFKNVGSYTLDESMASTRNCENMIGAVQIPLGVAGPLLLRTSNSELQTYLPLATTEGALVASINRGCKVITESGGATVVSKRAGVTRGPVYKVDSIVAAQKLETFLTDEFKEIKSVAESTSSHLKLLKFDTKHVGTYFFVRFYFDTSDAMGLNMVTIATTAISMLIEKKLGVKSLGVSGNFCVDKKPSWQNSINERGFAVHAEITIPQKIVVSLLKTTPEKFYETWLAKCMIGSAVSGSLGFNGHAANVIAAMYIATGQDPAHVVEGSSTVTTTEIVSAKDLQVNVYLPSILVGTVGGGTTLGTAQESLKLLGLAGGNDGKNGLRLSEVVGAAVLAGEISELASLSAGTLSKAHESLARGKR